MTYSPVGLELPFRGRWRARNSPARKVPSHGSHAFGTTYAIDFIPVDAIGRSAPFGWRSLFFVESPESFVGFGWPVLAPAARTVVMTHDGEIDHEARRSQLHLLVYALSQANRVRGGAPAIAGNHVVLALSATGPFVLLAHLRRGSVSVETGDRLQPGDPVGECGNSGNSTQPHLHVQVTDSTNWESTRGLPIRFHRPGADPRSSEQDFWMPAESEIVHSR